MKTLWPYSVHTSSRGLATYFTKYLSHDETYQGRSPSVLLFVSEGQLGTHGSLGASPHPLSQPPPSENPPGSAKGRRDESEWEASQRGIFSDQFVRKLEQNLIQCWIEYFLETILLALQSCCIRHCDSWLIHFLTVSIRYKMYKWLTGIIMDYFNAFNIYLNDSLSHIDNCLTCDYDKAYPAQSWCSGGRRFPSWPWPPCQCWRCTCTWCRPLSLRSSRDRLCCRNDLTMS